MDLHYTVSYTSFTFDALSWRFILHLIAYLLFNNHMFILLSMLIFVLIFRYIFSFFLLPLSFLLKLDMFLL